ncbi:MAG: amidohydrolase family protein [Bacteroidota bacterium]|nr:amidohydrolase family protein [Bacteroidota bacterium]
MRKISANYIFPVSGAPLKNGIIVLDSNNVITDIIDTGGNLKETANLEYYNGIIVPGFVNSHCHIELSHLKGKLQQKTGLPHFISQVNNQPKAGLNIIHEEIQNSHDEMIKNGIVAVGDICNTSNSFTIKASEEISYHSFIEIFGLEAKNAKKIIQNGEMLLQQISKIFPHPHSLIPHAPYSVSPELFTQLSHFFQSSIVSIHNQESKAEKEMFNSGKGALYNSLSKFVNLSKWDPEHNNSLQYSLNYLQNSKQILLVHNTFTDQEDLKIADPFLSKIYWVLCPNANLYIENQLPDIKLLRKHKLNIALGTDSLASNSSLSILEEIKTISSHFPDIKLEELIKWGTLNGAKALNFSNQYGSLEVGKKPGINLISTLDLENMKINSESVVKKLA